MKLQVPKPQRICAHSDTLLPLPSGFRTSTLTLKAQCGTGLTPNQRLYSLTNSHPSEQEGGEVTATGPQICNHKPQHLHRKHKPCFSQPPRNITAQQTQHSLCCLRWRRETCFYVCTKVHAGKGSDTLVRGTLQGLRKITEKQGFACPKATSREAYK